MSAGVREGGGNPPPLLHAVTGEARSDPAYIGESKQLEQPMHMRSDDVGMFQTPIGPACR